MAEQTVTWKAETILDVRPELESGGEPFVRIMEAAASIKPGGTLVIIAPFEPVPLYDILGARGFSHNITRVANDEWVVRFPRCEFQGEEQVEQEKENASGNMLVFDIRKLSHFREEGPYVQVLSDMRTARLVLFAFKSGQQLKEHTTTSQTLMQVLRGRIMFTAAGNSIGLQAGMVIQVGARVPHQVIAQTNAVLLVTMIPSPAYHSLEREIFHRSTFGTMEQAAQETGAL